MKNRDSFAQEHASADHISSFFRKLRLDRLLLHFLPRLVRSAWPLWGAPAQIGSEGRRD
jgi:hypothetical protein